MWFIAHTLIFNCTSGEYHKYLNIENQVMPHKNHTFTFQIFYVQLGDQWFKSNIHTEC